MANKPCLVCGRPSPNSRCPAHPAKGPQQNRHRRGLGWRYEQARSSLIDEWVAANGWTCPGWQRDPHPVTPGQLTADHIKPRAHHPELAYEPSNLAVLCARCNRHKGTRPAV
jgi:5-methylcytosine-specific restriction endonuclease McrA